MIIRVYIFIILSSRLYTELAFYIRLDCMHGHILLSYPWEIILNVFLSFYLPHIRLHLFVTMIYNDFHIHVCDVIYEGSFSSNDSRLRYCYVHMLINSTRIYCFEIVKMYSNPLLLSDCYFSFSLATNVI